MIKDCLTELLQPMGLQGKGLEDIFSSTDDFADKAAKVKQWCHRQQEELCPYLIDLLVIHEISTMEEETMPDEEAESFFMDEWEAEGSELLTLLIYLKDCKVNAVKPSLYDFLYDFLINEEEEDQDLLELYEPFIRNQELVMEDAETIIATGAELDKDVFEDLWRPWMLFFHSPDEKPASKGLEPLEAGLMNFIFCFRKSL